jgi:acyl carrier protein
MRSNILAESDIVSEICNHLASQLNLVASDIAPDQDFFAIGLESIRAIVLMNVLEQKYGIQLKIRDIFTNLTAATLAASIQRKLNTTQ